MACKHSTEWKIPVKIIYKNFYQRKFSQQFKFIWWLGTASRNGIWNAIIQINLTENCRLGWGNSKRSKHKRNSLLLEIDGYDKPTDGSVLRASKMREPKTKANHMVTWANDRRKKMWRSFNDVREPVVDERKFLWSSLCSYSTLIAPLWQNPLHSCELKWSVQLNWI